MPAPLALAAPAAIAGLAYLDAKLGFAYDMRLLGGLAKSQIKGGIREKRDRLSLFYVLEDQALGKNANHVLLIFEGQEWTYKQVYETALKYGTWLKTKFGIKPKDIVAMDYMNSPQFIFLWFGLWAIGAKPAFINYNLTSKALAHCIRVSTARVVIVDPEVQANITQEVRDELANVHFEVLTPALQLEALATEGIREPDSTRSEDKRQNMAILIYTSGTTGLPKPAIVSWIKVITAANFVPWWLHFKTSDIFYSCMPLYHSSASLLGFGMVLSWGATFSLGKKFSTKTFWQEVRASNATCMQYVGETCRYLLAAPPQFDPVTGENLDKKNKIRAAFGNGLRPEIWERFKERFDIEAIGEFYSATEGTSGAWNYSRNNFSKGAIGRFGTLGMAFMGSASALVELDIETEQPYRDPKTGFCRPIPRDGRTGELLFYLDAGDISSKFQGYFNNDASTESKIMRNVFKKGDAYFRTGDLVSYDDQGHTYFSDRIGDTFRWKAENVSTNEVSEVVGAHPAVHEANVYGVQLPHHDGRAGCVALVLSEEVTPAFLKEFATHASSNLPRFAVPLFVRRLKKMQITGTNKQQKHVVRNEGVDPTKVGDDDLYWLQDGTYVKFHQKDWDELNAGRVRL